MKEQLPHIRRANEEFAARRLNKYPHQEIVQHRMHGGQHDPRPDEYQRHTETERKGGFIRVPFGQTVLWAFEREEDLAAWRKTVGLA